LQVPPLLPKFLRAQSPDPVFPLPLLMSLCSGVLH
jgi:hypothetical protein